MNPWPDDYTEPPDQVTVVAAFKALRACDYPVLGGDVTDAALTLGHYLHHLTEELAGLQAVCDEQAAELTRRDLEDAA